MMLCAYIYIYVYISIEQVYVAWWEQDQNLYVINRTYILWYT